MVESRQRTSQRNRNQKFIIESKRVIWRELLVYLFTAIVWTYSLSVIYFFVNAIFNLNHTYPKWLQSFFNMTNEDISYFTLTIFVLFVLIYLVLTLWSVYNKMRFGTLVRRKYPAYATEEDLLSLGMVEKSEYEQLQQAKEITFQLNPIKRMPKL